MFGTIDQSETVAVRRISETSEFFVGEIEQVTGDYPKSKSVSHNDQTVREVLLQSIFDHLLGKLINQPHVFGSVITTGKLEMEHSDAVAFCFNLSPGFYRDVSPVEVSYPPIFLE